MRLTIFTRCHERLPARRRVCAVLILLPPSEGKSAPSHGDPVDVASLSHPELADARLRVAKALATVSGQRNALTVLGAGVSLAEEVARNTTVLTNPTAPAAQVYTGVLFDAAGMATWDEAAVACAADRILISSALWGAVTPADRIPAYRLSAGTTLGRLGNVTTFWRPRLGTALTTESPLIVDCRSGGYAAMWSAPKDRTVAVRVERERNGKRSVVSHFAKHWRGLLVRELMGQPKDPATPEELASAASGIDGVTSVELTPGTITLVVAG